MDPRFQTLNALPFNFNFLQRCNFLQQGDPFCLYFLLDLPTRPHFLSHLCLALSHSHSRARESVTERNRDERERRSLKLKVSFAKESYKRDNILALSPLQLKRA